ncbi:MAG: RsmE family RNA methyltransferase [Verrucomicrobia bacterium]|jgi:RsmE family RNA methyltransferase|nr:RsmE family RNA methyltransferase [Verrucomicrobiota bacterium]
MNLILFDAPFEVTRLAADDPRAQHLFKVLRVRVGTKVFVGFAQGMRARAEVTLVESDGAVTLKVIGTELPPKPLPIRLLIGLPRPHTAKRILFEAASMGVQALHFFESERSEPSYARSSLWATDAWKDRLRLGTEQSFGTHIPEVAMHTDLQSAITYLRGSGTYVALDNYEAAGPLPQLLEAGAESAVIALGSERGWSPGERDIFRKNGWKLAHLGAPVMRLETACTAAVSATAACLEFYETQTSTEL